MNLIAEKSTESFLLRLRKMDTPTGVSAETVAALMEKTGLSKTEIAHLALREMANRYLPKYEKDDGPLTQAQLDAIAAKSTANSVRPELFNKRLF